MSYRGFLWIVGFSVLLSIIPVPWPLAYLRPDFLLSAFLVLGLRQEPKLWIGGLSLLSGLFMDVALHVPMGSHGLVYSFSYMMAGYFQGAWNHYSGTQKGLLVVLLLFLSQLIFVLLISWKTSSLWFGEVMRLLCLNAIVWMASYGYLRKLLLSKSGHRMGDRDILL